jgi:hypothetical protein
LQEFLITGIEKGSSGRGDLFSTSEFKSIHNGKNSREADNYFKCK